MKKRIQTDVVEEPGSRYILDALRRLVRGLHLYARHCETHLGLSAAQLYALRKIGEAGTLDLRGLAQATLTDLSSVSVVADRLKFKGLVHRRRAPDDGRRIELTLSPSGSALLKRSPDPLQSRLVEYLRKLPAVRRRALERDLVGLVRDVGLDGHAARLFFEDKT